MLECLRATNDLIDTQPFAADDQFMAAKSLLTELFMFRSVSDSVGLVTLKCLQAASEVGAVTEARATLDMMIRGLTRIHQAPYLSFDEACSLADALEKAAPGPLRTPGYDELASDLIVAAER